MPARATKAAAPRGSSRSAQGQSNIPVRQPTTLVFPSLQSGPATQYPQTPPRRPGRATAAATDDGEEFPGFNEVQGSSDEEETVVNSPPIPIIVSPGKRRAIAYTINRQSDADVWGMSDDEILAATISSWRSDVYDHYTVALKRNESTHTLSYVFTCKTCPDNHSRGPITRLRSKTGDGTTNLRIDVEQCLKKQGLAAEAAKEDAVIPYSEAAHRALIALRCAKNARPFNMVEDEDYIREVQMLRPGTKIPKAITVQRDLHAIYKHVSVMVQNYFMQLNSTVHLVLDGWTAPLVSSYLGLVIVWCEDGVIHRAILEFIRLKKKHDGQYLAEVVGDCMKRWGLDKKLLAICMDNASNCSKMAEILPEYLPDFWGMDARLRCLAHIINLVAKIFISFFFKRPKVKKAITVDSGTGDGEREIVLEAGVSLESEDPVIAEEADVDSEANEKDDGEKAHDDAVVKSLRDIAIREMAREGVVMTEEEENMALKLFPAVAGLARRIHDNSTLNEQFQELVAKNKDKLQSNKTALDRRVPTRWNADFDCLAAHLHFKDIVQSITAVSNNKLQAYRLSDSQWDLAEDVQEVLLLFKDITLLFSQAEVPLIVDAIPTLFYLRDSLNAAANDDSQLEEDEDDDPAHETPAVIRIAAHASVLLINKYMDLIWDCEIYVFAMVMCPDRKLDWLKNFGVDAARRREIRKQLIDRFQKSYLDVALTSRQNVPKGSRWDTKKSATPNQFPLDDIRTYLKEDPIPSVSIQELGGYIKYWHMASKTRPRLARMGLAYCSAPATSVDAERAFSTGRRQVNFMQHNMSSQTFKARMALGSWAKTPVLPEFSEIAAIVKQAMSRETDLGSEQSN